MGIVITEAAKALAIKWHADTRRRMSPSLYVTHPIAVAEMLARCGFTQDVVAAAYCHDLLEDTDCPEAEIEQACGLFVVAIVLAVTHDKTLKWRERKAGYIEQVRKGPPEAKAVCVADKIHNLRCFLEEYAACGPSIWSNFHSGPAEKLWFERSVLSMLEETFEHCLVDELAKLVEQLEAAVKDGHVYP